MAEKELLVKEKLEYDGLFDFSGLYSFVHSWLVEEGYGVSEDKYSEKIDGSKKKLSIDWSASRVLGDYFKDQMKISYSIRGLEDVEVEIDKKVKKMNRGSVEVTIKSAIVKDYKHVWEKPGLSRVFREFYNKYLFKERIDTVEEIVGGSAKSLKESIKGYLELSGKR